MKDDLDVNSLLDDGEKIVKKGLSAYEKTQRLTMYFMIGKVVLAFIVIVGILWGGYSFVAGLKSMVTDAAISEAKEVASEKMDAAKGKVAGIKAKLEAAKTKRESEKGDDASDSVPGPQALTSAFLSFTKSVNEKITAGVGDALVEVGVHPDAPTGCAFLSDGQMSDMCLPYSDREISSTDYGWIKLLWKDDLVCSGIYNDTMALLKKNGKITENDKRLAMGECINLRDQSGDAQREERKQKMLEEL